ncbi:hypothetical protein ACMFMF_002125 [Clarireedia jacksonii]
MSTNRMHSSELKCPRFQYANNYANLISLAQSPTNPTPSLYDKSDSSSRLSSPKSPPSTNIQTPKTSSATASRIEKRKLNTLAARRYRQKRVDQMSSLENALREAERERDALRVRVAKLEGETEILKQLLSKKT